MGDEGVNATIPNTLTFSEPVTVTGAGLNDGGTATYQGIGADGKTLTFKYTVSGTDTSVPALAITGVTNGASVTSAAGNAANFAAADTTFNGLQIDTVEAGELFDPWAQFVVPTFPLEVPPAVVHDFVESQSAVIGCDPSAMALVTTRKLAVVLHWMWVSETDFRYAAAKEA
jgi:hypothetical protein